MVSLHSDRTELVYVTREGKTELCDDCKYADAVSRNAEQCLSCTYCLAHSSLYQQNKIATQIHTIFAASQEFEWIAIVHCNSLHSIPVTGVYMTQSTAT